MPPAGFKRSRALWDRVGQPSSASDDGDQQSWRPLLRAVLYELQPIRRHRLQQYYYHHRGGGGTVGNWTRPATAVTSAVRRGLAVAPPAAVRLVGRALRAVRRWTWRGQWRYVVGIALYCQAVRWMHAALEAGPFVVILTALAAIFTVGLSDNDSEGGLSAYSVFNRGFQKLLGSVDADALLQQYVGGGGGGAVMMMAGAGGGGMPAANNGENNNIEPPAPPAPPLAARRRNLNDDDDGGSEEDGEEEPNDNNNNNHNRNRARRSNKKSRGRRDTEQRREIQRQRQAAAALGFDGIREEVAMNRLLDEDR